MKPSVQPWQGALCAGILSLLNACSNAPPQPVSAAPSAVAATAAPVSPALAQAQPELLLNRLSWGASAASAQQLRQIGVAAYLDGQLHPRQAALPTSVQAQIDAMTISQKPFEQLMHELDAQRRAAEQHKGADDSLRKSYHQELKRLAHEAASRTVLRALYAPDQLQEQMSWFWMNHFNIYHGKHNVPAMLGDFEEHAIRPQALGNFRDLLRATVFHPAMLRYLDNEHNAVNRINENYARELLELHTMGVDGGYSQQDVQELARVLTGFGINNQGDSPHLRPELQKLYLRRGLFEFNPARHDFGDKQILGQRVRGRGLAEIDEVIDLLCRQPATAHFVSRKLALYFVSDTPSEQLTGAMSAAFLRSGGNIAATLRVLFDAPEFAASLGGKFKDPVHYVLSSVRLAYDQNTIRNTAPILHWLNQLGQQFNGHATPDGYALVASAWNSPAQLNQRFELAQSIAAGSPALFRVEGQGVAAAAVAPALAQAPYVKNWAHRLSPATQATLGQAATAQEWNALFLSSPEMMQR